MAKFRRETCPDNGNACLAVLPTLQVPGMIFCQTSTIGNASEKIDEEKTRTQPQLRIWKKPSGVPSSKRVTQTTLDPREREQSRWLNEQSEDNRKSRNQRKKKGTETRWHHQQTTHKQSERNRQHNPPTTSLATIRSSLTDQAVTFAASTVTATKMSGLGAGEP